MISQLVLDAIEEAKKEAHKSAYVFLPACIGEKALKVLPKGVYFGRPFKVTKYNIGCWKVPIGTIVARLEW